jgi:hypothetical protein
VSIYLSSTCIFTTCIFTCYGHCIVSIFDWLIGLGLWCLLPLSTILQLYYGSQFCSWRKLEYAENTADLPQVTDRLYHIMLYQVHLGMSVIWTHNFHLKSFKRQSFWVAYCPLLVISDSNGTFWYENCGTSKCIVHPTPF